MKDNGEGLWGKAIDAFLFFCAVMVPASFVYVVIRFWP